MANSIGTRIAEARKRKGLTQDQLAEAMGVSPQAVSKWENDISCPDITLLPQLADYFGISVDDLLRGASVPEAQIVPEGERKDFNKMMLRINVLSAEGDKVKVNLPMPLLKTGLQIGMNMENMGNYDALKDIDFDAILKMVENGVIGKLVEIESADGDIVEIVVE
jgi:transcriptional regulator with XRE-family HTH domain